MSKKVPTIGILIPCFNEEQGLAAFFNVLQKTLDPLGFNFEYLFIDDGSSDQTMAVIKHLQQNEAVKYLAFSRNFGKEIALTAGLQAAQSYDAVIMIDADGQHPPALIEEMLTIWQSGSDIVVGRRIDTVGLSLVRKLLSKTFNALLNSLPGGSKTEDGLTDYRLLDKKVVVAFSQLSEHNRITRGLIDWLGFRRQVINFTAAERQFGTATYGTRALLRLALHAFVSQSTRPLKFIGILGFLISSLAGVSGVLLLIVSVILKDPYNWNISGTFYVGIFIAFMCGLVLIAQGLIALYIENIYTETQARPLYIIKEKS